MSAVATVAMAFEPTVGGRLWLPHKAFDIRSAEVHGPSDGNVLYLCPGDLYVDAEALEEGDAVVLVECDHCDYVVGVHADDVLGAPGAFEDRPPIFWWQR